MKEPILLKTTMRGPSPVVLGLLLLITGLYALSSVLLLEEMLHQEDALAGDGDAMLYGVLPLVVAGLPWSILLGSLQPTYSLWGPLVNLVFLLGVLWLRDRRYAKVLADAIMVLSSRRAASPVRGWRWTIGRRGGVKLSHPVDHT